jgi:hypothetical protein
LLAAITSSSRPSLRLSSQVPSWLPSWLPFAYSPFSMSCIDAAIGIAVEECIDLCQTSVKKKTLGEWKKWQQFF